MKCSDISIDMYVLQVGELVNFNISYTNYNKQKDAYRSKLVTLKLHMITEKISFLFVCNYHTKDNCVDPELFSRRGEGVIRGISLFARRGPRSMCCNITI